LPSGDSRPMLASAITGSTRDATWWLRSLPDERYQPLAGGGVVAVLVAQRLRQSPLLDSDPVNEPGRRRSRQADGRHPVPEEKADADDRHQQSCVARMPDNSIGATSDDRLVAAGLHGEGEIPAEGSEAPESQGDSGPQEDQAEPRADCVRSDGRRRQGSLNRDRDERAADIGSPQHHQAPSVGRYGFRSSSQALPELQDEPG